MFNRARETSVILSLWLSLRLRLPTTRLPLVLDTPLHMCIDMARLGVCLAAHALKRPFVHVLPRLHMLVQVT